MDRAPTSHGPKRETPSRGGGGVRDVLAAPPPATPAPTPAPTPPQDIEAVRRRRSAGDELMLAVAKHFVRDPLGVATPRALAEVGRFLGAHGLAVSKDAPADDPAMCCAWHAEADPRPPLEPLLINLTRGRRDRAVGRPWRWRGLSDARGQPVTGPLDPADPDGRPARGVPVLAMRVMARPVLVDGEPAAQVALALGDPGRAEATGATSPLRAWREEDHRLLAFLAEMYAIAMARSRDRSARADTEHRLESYTRNLPGAVWRRLLTPDGRLLYTYLSSGVKRLTEVDPTQAVIDSGLLQGVLHPDDRDGVLDSIHRSARDLTDWAREFRIVSKSGSVRWVHASGKVQGLEDGTVAWDGITLDVTDRKRSEQALRESEARFRSAFNQAAEGMGLISPEGRWLRVNRSLATLLGAPPEHIAGTSVVLWLAPRDRPVFQDLLRRATEDGGAVLDGEVRVRPAGSGPWARYDSASTDPIDAVDDPGEGDPADDDTAPESHVWIRTKAAPVRDENGALRHWVAHVQDVSARRATEALLVRARDQAEATARAKSDFVAMMSHEIRTPLSGMIGLARLLQDGSLSADQARNVGRIETSARLLLTLLDDVLALSKAEAGQGAAELAPVSPAAVISEVLGLLMANAAGKGLTLTMDVDPALPARLTGPRLVMRQVLFNLVGNAVKFTPAGAVTVGARLETTPHGATVLDLTVTDTGPGVRAEDRARIFDPFSQGGPGAVGEVVGVRGRRPGGVGLGLAICRRLVEGVGGRIAVEDAVGGGALFRVTLPVDTTVPAVRRGIRADDADETGAQDDDGDDDGEDDRDEAGETAGGQGRPARCPIVLVVDDDDINREVLEATLAALDCVPRGFTGGVDLLAAARAWPPTAAAPDLILMDLNMPDPDGVRTTRRLRDLGGAWARVPVLAVTAAAGRHPPEACTRAGMADCLFKPVEAATLARVLTAWVPGMAAPGAGAPDTPNAAPDAAPEAVPPLLDESVWARRLALLGRARLTDRVRDLRDLSAAVRAGDSEATHAHRLAGAAATLGARRLAAAAWTLERAVSRTLAGPDVETSPAPPAARAALRAARDATLAALDARLSPEP